MYFLAIPNLKWTKRQIETEAISVCGLDCDRWHRRSALVLDLSLHADSAVQRSRDTHLGEYCYQTAGFPFLRDMLDA